MQNKFMFATGIENSNPNISLNGRQVRVDEMEKAGHYQHWKRDFALVKELGIEFLRYGPPYYSSHLSPGKYDWTFADEAFAELKRLKITPIVDLCHFGMPDWLGNFQNTEWPGYFAEYAAAFAKRFPHIKLYTPVNEIYVAAAFSALYGWWNERLKDERAFVTAMKNLCKANVLAMQAILTVKPDATFIQSESTEYFHAEDPSCIANADFLNQKRFLSLDLSYGHQVNVPIYNYLLDNGMTRAEYEWFQNSLIKGKCIMGNDYYAGNEHMVHPDGTITDSGEIFGYYTITRQYYNRYRIPVMHTETNTTEPDCVSWLSKEWANLHRFKQDGFSIVGFTWYSLTDQVDWDTVLLENNGNVNRLGLYDLDRQIRPVGVAYKKLISVWKSQLDDERFGLHTGL